MKKILACVLVSAFAFSMATTSFAATGIKYTDIIEPLGYGYSGSNAAKDTIDLGTINADEVTINLPLVAEMFDKSASGKLSAADIRASKLAVRTQMKSGSKVVKDVTLDNKDSQIEVEFVKEWVSTKAQDFEVFVYLTMDGKRKDAQGVTIIGTLENPIIDVYKDYDYVDISDGSVAYAHDFVNKIQVDLGNGVSIFTKLFNDKKYYGIASREVDQADDVVFAKYPDVDNVVTLKTVGLNSTGDVVKLDTDYSEYYVYDKDLNYIGRSNEMLPYSTKYYLANKKLDVETTEPSDEPSNTEEPAVEAPANVNANPGTGR